MKRSDDMLAPLEAERAKIDAEIARLQGTRAGIERAIEILRGPALLALPAPARTAAILGMKVCDAHLHDSDLAFYFARAAKPPVPAADQDSGA